MDEKELESLSETRRLMARAKMRAELDWLVRRINAELGAPMDSHIQVGGSRITRIGHYHLDHREAGGIDPMFDGWTLMRYSTIHGDTHMLFPRSSMYWLKARMEAFLVGAKEQRTWNGARS